MADTFTESELALLHACPLFAGMDDAEITAALPLLNTRRRRFAKGAYVQRADEPFRYAGLVLSGAVTGQFVTEEYNMVTLNRYTPGGFFGLTFALVARPKSPVQILAS
ncbi:MAG: cyclic nucleotide-binding domain-containing protein, partial [Eggerthellaceae bacterium]|nr:cyclic nucleotide-binding domain-containing protein [Eggerthellaceae bacterium]